MLRPDTRDASWRRVDQSGESHALAHHHSSSDEVVLLLQILILEAKQ